MHKNINEAQQAIHAAISLKTALQLLLLFINLNSALLQQTTRFS